MWGQLRTLIKLELCNIFGLNVFRFSKDKKAKSKSVMLLAVCICLLIMMVFYVGSLAAGLILLGAGEVVPSYLLMISSLLIFIFGMFKAGSVIFRKGGYDILCALPVSSTAVVAGRLVRMYVENLLIVLAVLLPGTAVYVWSLRPGPSFFLTLILGVWFVPLIPMAGAILIGALITGISSRMRHKSLAAAGLSILAMIGILYGSMRISAVGDISLEMLKELTSFITELLGKVYPPAVWLGWAAVQGNLLQGLLFAGASLGMFGAVSAGTAFFFHQICRSLFGSSARHDYRMGRLKEDSLLVSLCRREFQRYFSSSVYVTNTIMGPIMGCVLAGALLVVGPDALTTPLPVPININGLIPFAFAGIFCMMTTTATSVSMEGKNWWIAKSLPLSAKNILDAKILMNLLLFLPFYFLSEIFLILALRPGAEELLWLLLIPAVFLLFSCVYGITVNLHFPVLNWENEVSVVKQSASCVLGGMGGFLLAIPCAAGAAAAPEEYVWLIKGGICLALLLTTGFLYWKNNRFDLCGKV